MAFTIPEQIFDGQNIPELNFVETDPFYWQNKTPGGSYNFCYKYTGFKYSLLCRERSSSSFDRFVLASENDGPFKYGFGTYENPLDCPTNNNTLIQTYTYDNKTVYWNSNNITVTNRDYLNSNSVGNDKVLNSVILWSRVAWLMVYGGYADNVTYNLTNCTGGENNPTLVNQNEPFNVSFTANEGYTFSGGHGEFQITGGHVIQVLAPSGKTIAFRCVMDEGATEVVITVTAGQWIRVRYVLNACHLGPQTTGTNPEYVARGELYDFNFIADTGYRFHSKQQDIATNEGIVLFDPRNKLPDTYCLIYGRVSADAESVVISVNLAGDPYEGLDGEEDPTGETITPPGLPGTTAVAAGIIGLFVPNLSQMRDLADFMWTNFGGSATTTDEILEEIVEALKRSISNPLDYIFGLNIIPSNGLSIGASKTVRFGYMSSNVSMSTLANQFFDVDCGSVSFGYECGGTFLDFAPYSKISLYLPYIGFRDVDANDFIGHTISIRYRCDAVSGACVAYVSKDGSVMYQYSGNCACTLPLNADSWARTIGAVVQAGSSIAGATAVGGAVGGLAGAEAGMKAGTINSAASVVGNSSLIAPKVNRVGSLAGAAGLLGIQYPFVVREAPRFHSTEGFNTVEGYPSWYFRQLGDVVGLTKVVNVHLHNIPALSDEIAEIETLLKGGVIL